MKKLLTFLMASILAIGVGWAETVTLSNANIVAAGDAADGYAEWTNLKDGGGNEWKAFAIKNQHSNATSEYHFLQIKNMQVMLLTTSKCQNWDLRLLELR